MLPKIRTVKRGDTDKISVSVYVEEQAVNLNGWTLWFTVRELQASESVNNDDDAVISKKIEVIEDTTSIVFDLTTQDTNVKAHKYFADIQYKKPDGTIKSKDFIYEIVADITRGS